MSVFRKNVFALCFLNAALFLFSLSGWEPAILAWFATFPPAFAGAVWLFATTKGVREG